MTDMLHDFLIESAEGIDLIDHHLIALEERPDDEELLTEIFRSLHTIKGSCGFYGFDKLESVAHSAENLLTLLRSGDLTFGPAIANALLAMVDMIRSILGTIERTGEEGEPEVAMLAARLDALADGGASEVDTSWDAVTADDPAATGDAPVEVGDGGGDAPTVREPADDRGPADEAGSTPGGGSDGDDIVERLGDRLVEAGMVDRQDVELAAAQQGLGDGRMIGEILVDEGKTSAADVARAAGSSPTGSVTESTIRVDVRLLDDLMNLVGELVLSRNELVRLATDYEDNVFVPPSQRLNLITTELQEGIMKTRMQPINSAWSKLPRVVRDLSHQLGKDVRVEMIGRETELDRTIIEAIRDPLTHIVRNTVDHGIEGPDERSAVGKDPHGTLTLRASHQGEQVNIEISDDGRGIDPERIRSVAVERGVIGRQEAEDLSDAEAAHLVFQPGFSTAESVTNISGRGVGMDVVKSNVERIGGSVDLRTEVGRGTTFTIKIPLTLAIIPALTVRADDNRYAIPQVNVLELLRLKVGGDDRIEDLHGAAVYRLRGKLLPVVDLREQLGLPPIETRTTNIAVVKTDTLRFGLVVDGIEDNGEIVVKPLSQQVKDLKLFSGATILGDGKVALILDLLGLADLAGLSAGSPTMKEVEAQQAADELSLRSVDAEALIVLSVGGGERVAIPLNEIDRLEEVPADTIERSDGRPVVQYRRALMPLVDLGQVIGLGGSVLTENQRINVVVCLSGGRTVGLAVDQILDIVHSDAVQPAGQPGTVIIDGLVTDLINPQTVVAAALPSLHRPADADQQGGYEGEWLPLGATT
ncbi:MAG: chemotaxis protein CheW [Actinomycetota bacterium]